MKVNRELKFFTYVVLMGLLWLPIAAWLMPRIAGAPTWNANPMWYGTSTVMGVVIAYVLRWTGNRIAAYLARRNLTVANR